MNLYEEIEKMSEDELKAILATEFDEELEKEASDEVAQTELENALYAYGAFKADLEVEAEEAGDEGMSKEAAEHFEAAETEISEAIEASVQELGLDDIEDDVELHKTAMAAATIIFEGYSDQMEKWAARSKKKDGKGLKGMYGSLKKKVGKAYESSKKHVGAGLKKGMKTLRKHPGKAAAIGAGTAALAYGAKKLHEKHASELTAGELIDLTLEKQATVEVIVDGIDKLAARGKAKAGLVSKGMGHLKAMHKSMKPHYKHMAGAGAAGAVGGGLLAHKMKKKSE